MLHETFLLLFLLSFASSDTSVTHVGASDSAGTHHLVHLKTSSGVKIKLLVSVPDGLQFDGDSDEVIDLPPSVIPGPENPEPESPEPEIPQPEVPEPEVPEPSPPQPPTPDQDGTNPGQPTVPDAPSQPVVPVILRTINGVTLRLHVNIPPEFQNIIEAHESITYPDGYNPDGTPILPEPEFPTPELPSPEVPSPEQPAPEEPSDPTVPEVPNPESPTVPESPEGPTVPGGPNDPQAPGQPDQPVSIPPFELRTQNGIKVKVFISVPPELAHLVQASSSITLPQQPNPSEPSLPDNGIPVAPPVQPEVPGEEEDPSEPGSPGSEVPAPPEADGPTVPDVPGEDSGSAVIPAPSQPVGGPLVITTDSGLHLRLHVNAPPHVQHLIEQQSEVLYSKSE